MTPYELLKKLQRELNREAEYYSHESPSTAIYFSSVKKKWASIFNTKEGTRNLGFFITRREAREAYFEAERQFRGY